MKHKLKMNKRQERDQELDGVFFLKLVMYLVLGSQWLRLTDDAGTLRLSLPVGLFIGVIFAVHDHFRIDRKIEFAVLLIAAMVGFYAMVGLSVVT